MLGGGELARDTSLEYTRSEIAGVEGRLREMLETDGWRERCLPRAAGSEILFSITAEVGVVSGFCAIVEVMRRVFGRIAEDSGVLEAAVAGVPGRLSAGGVATTEAANTVFGSVTGDCVAERGLLSRRPVESRFVGTDLAGSSLEGDAFTTGDGVSVACTSWPPVITTFSSAAAVVRSATGRPGFGPGRPELLSTDSCKGVNAESSGWEASDAAVRDACFAGLASTPGSSLSLARGVGTRGMMGKTGTAGGTGPDDAGADLCRFGESKTLCAWAGRGCA